MKTEQIVTMPIRNPETGAPAKAHRFAGRLDLIEDGVLCDWKTVSDPRKFLDIRTLSYQGELYALASTEPIKEIQYRLIQRPAIRYCKKDADRQAYEDRCIEWLVTHEGTTLEHVHHINPARMKQARAWLWSVHKRVLHCERHGYLPSEHGCYAWHRECPYLPLCLCTAQGGDVGDIIAERYQRREVSHAELGNMPPGTITYSSASCLALCERKYQRKHKEMLDPKRQDEGDALLIGSVAHVGLEHYKRTGGEQGGLAAIDVWEAERMTLGEDDARRQDQNVAQARAIVRVAALRWPHEPRWKDAEPDVEDSNTLF